MACLRQTLDGRSGSPLALSRYTTTWDTAARSFVSSTLAPVQRTQTDEKVLEMLGLWAWFLSTNPDRDALTSMRNAVLNGLAWPYTPYRALDLVHAVRNPLLPPALGKLNDMTRDKEGQTWAGFSGSMPIDGLSTLKVDLEASWSEIRDAPGSGIAPSIIRRHAHAAEIEIALDQRQVVFGTSGKDGSMARHEFHDTRHRVVDYHSKATTRFREYFQAIPTKMGDLPPNETPNNLNSGKTTIGLHVPSSRRPDPPKVAYVVPTFEWTAAQSADSGTQILESSRSGGGLRIWLERPWFSSGEGEQLAVVFAPAEDKTGGSGFTQLARDPIWGDQGAGVDAVPLLRPESFFPRPRIVDAMLPETGPVRLAVFDVAFQSPLGLANFQGPLVPANYASGRDMWFVDLAIPPDLLGGLPEPPYAPLVRLALARYQSHSVDGCALSRMVFTDFMPLLPERRTTLRIFSSPPPASSIEIFIAGTIGRPHAFSSPADRIVSKSHAFIQSRRHGDTDLAWHDLDGPLSMSELTVVNEPPPIPFNAPAPSTPARSHWRGMLRLSSTDPGFEYRVVAVESETVPDLL